MTGRHTTRICAGEYERTDGENTVTISRIEYHDGPGWIAAARWDRFRYTDPIATKREAVAAADYMLDEPHV